MTANQKERARRGGTKARDSHSSASRSSCVTWLSIRMSRVALVERFFIFLFFIIIYPGDGVTETLVSGNDISDGEEVINNLR